MFFKIKNVTYLIISVFTIIMLSMNTSVLANIDSTNNFSEIADPHENINREIMDFNLALDRELIRPVARIYDQKMPEFIRHRIHDFLVFLSTPLNIVNNALQGDLKSVGRNAGRLGINVISLGLVDIADKFGLKNKKEDFGQTLAIYGIPEGNFLVVPLLGPMTTREATGRVVDFFINPVSMLYHNTNNTDMVYPQMIGDAVDTRSRNYEILDSIEEDSLDPYAKIRSLYWQSRLNILEDK